jgi:hypothetical protein
MNGIYLILCLAIIVFLVVVALVIVILKSDSRVESHPGAPCIYYGDEIGLDGEHDPSCRKSFPWEESKWDQRVLSDVKQLVALRRQTPPCAAVTSSACGPRMTRMYSRDRSSGTLS